MQLAFCFFLGSICVKAHSQIQKVKFSLLSGTSGVTLGKINGMTRDKYGFMWFSDQSNRSIVRYDGSHMKRYQYDPNNPNGLGGFYPECLFADSKGNIWIGFFGMGVDKFDPVSNTFIHYRHDSKDPQSLSNDSVNAIIVDHLGKIWVASFGGLDELDEETGKFKNYKHNPADPKSLSYNIVRALYEDKAGDIWVGTGFAFRNEPGGGLNRFNRGDGSFTRYFSDSSNPQTLAGNKVRAIFEDSYGNFWIGTNEDGLQTLDRKTGIVTRFPYDPSNPSKLSRGPRKGQEDHITFITEDASRKLWIGTLSNGIIRYDPSTRQVVRYGSDDDKSSEFKDNSSWWANATADGFVWISTQRNNLFKVDIYNTTFPNYGSGPNDGLYSILEESDSVIWQGSANGAARRNIVTGRVQYYRNEPGNFSSLSNNMVYVIFRDKKKNLWLGTRNGLNLFNPAMGKFRRYYHDSVDLQTAGNMVPTIIEDRDSNIWVGCYGGGVDVWDHRTGKITNLQNKPTDLNSLNTDLTIVLAEDPSGDIWAGLDNNGGLNRINRHTRKVTRYLQGIVVNSIRKTPDGEIWIGSPSGLYHYNRQKDSLILFGEVGSISNVSQIRALTSDLENRLWLSTEGGIYMVNKSRDQAVRFGREYGIDNVSYHFHYGAAFCLKNGDLIFGNDLGYISFDPARLEISGKKTQLYFTEFRVNDKSIIPGFGQALTESLFEAKEIRLNYNQNVFSFSATLIDFRNESGKRIYYLLENYDKDWRSVEPEEWIQYFKLPPGKYVMHIKSANEGSGDWTEKQIAVSILPPWWLSWWAYVLYFVGFVVTAYSIYKEERRKIIQRERMKTKERELAQSKEIEKAYHTLKETQVQLVQSEKMASLGELTAGIAHEIQNPLNFVNNFAELNRELIQDMNLEIDNGNLDAIRNIAKDIASNEERIAEHGRRADSIVKGMLQHSRTSTGVKEPTNINALCDEYLRLCYHGLRAKDKGFNAQIETHFDSSIPELKVVPQELGRVLLNICNNAFYAVHEKRNIAGAGYQPTVKLTTKSIGGQIAEIRIEDNGNGIPGKILEKIFQPFFTTKPTGQGTGLGLSMSYDIIKAHGGQIHVNSTEGKGTTFVIEIPMTT